MSTPTGDGQNPPTHDGAVPDLASRPSLPASACFLKEEEREEMIQSMIQLDEKIQNSVQHGGQFFS